MSKLPGYKQRHIIQYTEVVYYDADGNEVGRDELQDAHTYDVLDAEPLTEDEALDYDLA